MKDSVRMAVTLMVIGIICAGVLGVVHGITAPIIEERQAQEFEAAIKEFLPQASQFEEKEIEGIAFVVGNNDAGELEGVVATVQVSGYNGPIEYNLVVDANGDITGIRIVSHEETPGIGDVIEEPEFQDQLIGKNVEDPVEIGNDVDTISGATFSTRPILLSVREVLNLIGGNFLGLEIEEEADLDLSTVEDGIYTGSAPGFSGDDIVVEVTVEGGKITKIEVIEHNDTPDVAAKAIAEMPGRIIEAQSIG
ncbi:MAG: FMN-binding protein [Dethiobacteria bacterium]|jgi:electron transport complex protein RnfG